MTGPALLLSADHDDPRVAAREARRRLATGDGANPDDRMHLVAAVIEEGFTESDARAAVSAISSASAGSPSDEPAPTRSCASGVDSLASDD